jgi:hypothetical protein
MFLMLSPRGASSIGCLLRRPGQWSSEYVVIDVSDDGLCGLSKRDMEPKLSEMLFGD